MDSKVDSGFFNLVLAYSVMEEENFEFKPAVLLLKLTLCRMLLVAEGLGKYILFIFL